MTDWINMYLMHRKEYSYLLLYKVGYMKEKDVWKFSQRKHQGVIRLNHTLFKLVEVF